MRASSLILIVLLAFLLTPIPQAMSATPAPLATVSDTLSLGETKDFTFTLPGDLEDFLLHVTVTASAPQTDRLDITIEGATWTDLQGDWWDAWGRYVDTYGPLTAGVHTLTAATSPDAANPVTFTVELYEIPTTPFTIQGAFPAEPYPDSDIAYIRISLPVAGSYPVTATATAGNFELIPEAPNEPVDVQGLTKQTMQFGEAGIYEFQVQADILGKKEATAWSITIGPPATIPSLNVKITEGCTGTAPGTSCIFGANATASDGSQPNVQYNWTTSGGCFINEAGGCVPSLLRQNANWTAPSDSGETTYRVTVNAAADGYESGTDTWPIVVPEFSSTGLALTISLVSATALILVGRRRRRQPLRTSN
jgi:hypothetical protein